jgi:6-pyruvoyltetrahydropterin/6-carboxytetrahydropterin synthase
MFRLTREVRFALNPQPDGQLQQPSPSNSYGGYPTLTGLGLYLVVRVTVAANQLDPESQYLLNIKSIDQVVRDHLVKVDEQVRRQGPMAPPSDIVRFLHSMLYETFRERFISISLALSPYLVLTANRDENPMMRLSQKFEFSACHRLHNPKLSDAVNRRTFGKCNNPLGHGHNYELQVTLTGSPGESGLLVDIPDFERTVAQTVIERFDHKNLNEEVPEFRELIPSVENIAKVIYDLLKPRLQSDHAHLATVTVWETPKTWCEYSE